MYLWFLRNKMALFKLRLSFPIQKKKKKRRSYFDNAAIWGTDEIIDDHCNYVNRMQGMYLRGMK